MTKQIMAKASSKLLFELEKQNQILENVVNQVLTPDLKELQQIDNNFAIMHKSLSNNRNDSLEKIEKIY